MRKEKIPTIKNGIKDVSAWLDAKHESAHRLALGPKAPQRTEIEVSFFQKCNLRCAFCWQDHDDPTGVNDIIGKSDVVLDYIHNWKYLKEDIVVTMTGGELFQDDVDYFDQYYMFMHCVLEEVEIDPSRISFTLISNLMFNPDTLDKVDDFLIRCETNGIKVSLGTSWDISGRPASPRFHRNLEYLKEYIQGITFVLTKPAIQRLLFGNYNNYFDYLYANYNIDFDYYVPTEHADKMMPSDWYLLNVFRLFVEKYPKLPTVKSWLKGKVNPITCGNLNKITILPDNSVVPCRQLDYCNSDFETPINPYSNKDMVSNYMDRHDCFGCEYYNKCTMTCFVMNDHVSYEEELDDCLYRKLFKEIDGLDNKTDRSV
jgi:sulfatase maturation enzyme AslB (radical SAM superfamily)